MTTDDKNLRNVKIMGESTIGAGPYNNINIKGNCRTEEDLSCKELKVMGDITIGQSLTCEYTRIMGTMKVKENCVLQKAHILGEVVAEGDWQSDMTSVMGKLSVNGKCDAEEMSVRGVLKVRGLFNFDRAEFISSNTTSMINEMGGRKIEVRKSKASLPRPFRSTILEAQSIEADEMTLDYTNANVLRGSRIRIGKHCRIGKVEYSESLFVEKGAVVEEQEKIIQP